MPVSGRRELQQLRSLPSSYLGGCRQHPSERRCIDLEGQGVRRVRILQVAGFCEIVAGWDMVWAATSAEKGGALASLSHLCPRRNKPSWFSQNGRLCEWPANSRHQRLPHPQRSTSDQ